MKTLVYFEYKTEEAEKEIHRSFERDMSKIGFNINQKTNLMVCEGGLTNVMMFNNIYEKYKSYFRCLTIIRAQNSDVTNLGT